MEQMEQVGTSGLPPLLPSVPVPVPVADSEQTVEQVVEQDLCSLTELVPVRSKQHTSASDRILAVEEDELVDDPLERQLDEDMQEDSLTSSSANKIGQTVVEIVVNKFERQECAQEDPHPGNEEDLNPDNPLEIPLETSDTNSEIRPETPSEARSHTPTFQVPPHLLGRTVENPTADIPPGRRTQKPRLGVRVPYRNLTSQIVTQNEIAQEIFERTQKKHPEMVHGMAPKGIANTEIFTRKLTQRLASSITSPTAKPKTAIVPESIGNLKALLPNKQSPAAAAAIVDGVRLSPGFTYNEKDKALDEAELLSILEGDGDPLWLPDKLLRKPENSQTGPSPTPTTNTVPPPAPVALTPPPPPPKLDPEVEKSLALKQLMELPIAFPPKKPEKKPETKRSRRRSGKAKQDVVENEIGVVAPPPAADAGNVNQPVVVEENGGNAENAPPIITPTTTPSAKKATSSRKRKMTPEVAAVLKKPKVSKKAEAAAAAAAAAAKTETNAKVDPKPETPGKVEVGETVSNGKAKGGKPATPTPPAETSKKKVSGNKKAPQPKTEAESVVANGSTETSNKKKAVKKSGKGKPEDNLSKKPAVKTTPSKTAKSPKVTNKASTAAANKTQGPTPPPKLQKTAELVTEVDDASEPTKDQAMEVVEEETAEVPQESVEKEPQTQTPQKKATRINRELEHLLGDEGAVNMLYAVEGHKRKGSKDLALKARLVKTAVMRLSSSPQGHMPLALRARRSLNVTEPPKLVKMSGSRKQRHHSSESLDSMRSPPYLTPVDSVGSQVFPPRQKLTADDSRIIRRHSTSSSYSSPDVSPRRASAEDGQNAAIPGTSGSPRKKGVPIFVRDKAKNLTYDGTKKPKVVNPVAFDSVLLKEQLLELSKKSNLLPNPAAIKTKDLRKLSEVNGRVKTELLKKMKKGLDTPSAIAKKVLKLQRAQFMAERKAAEELAKAQKVAEELRQVQQEVGALDEEDVLPIVPAVIKQEGKRNSAPHSPDAASYSNLLKSLHPKGKKAHEERQRATARHCAGTYNYKEITVRRYDNVVHIILAPVSTKMSSSLNIQVLRELRDALQQVRKDDQCKVVLLTSSGSIFCQGIDVSGLIQNNLEKRKTAAFEMSLALKDFLKCIAHFPKPLVAGVQGAAVGLGVTMLPLFDMVFASDKATFHTPYAQLGQVPDGGATLTLPYILGHTATSELLLNCRKLTANEALKCGLVTRVLWPDRFLEELIPIVKNIAQQSAQSMEATKALLRHGLRTKFDAALESETHLLVEHWTSKECQLSFQGMVESGEVSLQRQRATDS